VVYPYNADKAYDANKLIDFAYNNKWKCLFLIGHTVQNFYVSMSQKKSMHNDGIPHHLKRVCKGYQPTFDAGAIP